MAVTATKPKQQLYPEMFNNNNEYNLALAKVGKGGTVTPTNKAYKPPAPVAPVATNAQQVKNLALQAAQMAAKNKSTTTTVKPLVPAVKPPATTQPKQYIAGASLPQKQASQDPGAQDLSGGTPGKLPNGMWDPNYIPKSEDEALSSGDSYTSQKWLANYYKDKGIAFDPNNFAANFDEDAQLFLKNQAEEKSLLEKQVEDAKSELRQSAKEDASAITSQFGVDREGVRSVGNEQAGGQIRARLGKKIDAQIDQLEQRKKNLEVMQKEQQQKYLAGREDMIRSEQAAIAKAQADIEKASSERRQQTMDLIGLLQKDNALAGLDDETLAYLEEGMPDAPPGVVSILANAATRNVLDDQAKKKMDNMNTAINTMKGLVTEGIALTPSMMNQIAKTTGLPMESLMSFNDRAAQIMADKNLDGAKKMGEIKKLGYELDRESRGIVNQTLQNVDYLKTMYRNGESADVIALVKNAMGIKDADDPMYRAELAYKQAQTLIEEKRLRGEPITIDDQIKLMEAEMNYSDLGGGGTGGSSGGGGGQAYVPNSSLEGIKTTFENGALNVTFPKGTRMQCGEFVNRLWGMGSGGKDGLPSEYSGKKKLVDRRGIKVDSPDFDPNSVAPGMAFVMPIAGKYSVYGHTGIVATKPDANGNFKTREFNADGKEHYSEQVRNISQMYGFAPPPSGSAKLIGSAGGGKNGSSNAVSGMTDQDILAAYEKAGKTFDTPADAKKAINMARRTGFVPGGGTSGGGLSEDLGLVVGDAAKGIVSYSQMIQGLDKKDIPKVKAEFSKQLQAMAESEDDEVVKKMIMSRAQGDPDQTSEQQWNKAEQGFGQLLDMKDTLERLASQGKTGILGSKLAGLNPTDPDVSLLKAQIAGLIPTVARGTFGEVGVLTDADISNYQQVVGNQDMTPEQVAKATDNLLKTMFRNYRNSVSSSSKNTSNRIEQYKGLKSRMPENLLKELGLTAASAPQNIADKFSDGGFYNGLYIPKDNPLHIISDDQF